MQSPRFLTLAFFLSISAAVQGQTGLDWAAVTNANSLQSGDGTFYGLGQDAQGTCSYSANFANTNDLPWSTGTALTVAMNNDQFADSAACGMCVKLRGTGAGLGTTPIPSTWTMALVNNRCPECAHGSIDLAAAGDGRWNIQWYAVPCEVGSTPLYYSIVVSSYYWFSMVVSNTRIPITGVSVKIGGTWLDLVRSNNNQWAYYNTNGPWQSSFPMGVRVTSVTGQTVEDTITSPSGNSGSVQFSADGTGSTAATAATTTGGITASTASPPGMAGTPPVMAGTPPVASIQAAATPPVSMSSPPPAGVAPPVSMPAIPPSAPNNLPSGSFYVENNQQCGGTSQMCNSAPYTSAPCEDAAWTSAVCRSSGYSCTRASAQMWQCLPGQGTPAGPPTPVSPPTTPPSPATQTPPTPTTQSPPPSPVAATPPAGINAAGGSYSTASTVSNAAAQSSTTPPAPTQTATTSSPSPPAQTPPASPSPTPPAPAAVETSSITSTPTETAAAAASTRSLSISAGGQCGGTSNCDPAGQPTDKVTCSNGPWANAACPSGYSCTANPGPLVWTCLSSSPATAGRRLLEAR